jgi:hypothetical protein
MRTVDSETFSKYLELLAIEAEKKYPSAKYCYIAGTLQSQLEWALGDERQRDVIIDTIEDKVKKHS